MLNSPDSTAVQYSLKLRAQPEAADDKVSVKRPQSVSLTNDITEAVDMNQMSQPSETSPSFVSGSSTCGAVA